jgi:hypothetical protein
LDLSEREWDIAEQLCKVLKVRGRLGSTHVNKHDAHSQILKDATLYFSRATPNLATVIPAMDEIDKRFGSTIRDPTFDKAIRSAMRSAKETLNKYYSLTDSSEAYRIAMGESQLLTSLSRSYVLFQSYIQATNSRTSNLSCGSQIGSIRRKN